MNLAQYLLYKLRSTIRRRKMAWAVKVLAAEGYTAVRMTTVGNSTYLVRNDGVKFSIRQLEKAL